MARFTESLGFRCENYPYIKSKHKTMENYVLALGHSDKKGISHPGSDEVIRDDINVIRKEVTSSPIAAA